MADGDTTRQYYDATTIVRGMTRKSRALLERGAHDVTHG